MKLTSAFRTQKSQHWATPESVYAALDKEFRFDADPCPLGATEGSWGKRNFINPPYNQILAWLRQSETLQPEVSVFLLPSRTGSAWFHEYANKASEIRFIRGRLQFNGCGVNAPFDSLIMIFRQTK